MSDGRANRRVLVTGAGGFIGAHLCAALAREGAEVHAMIRPGSNLNRLEHLGVSPRMHRMDLTESDRVTQAVRDIRPDVVFNLATNRRENDWHGMIQTNVVGAMTVLQACNHPGFRRFVTIGSALEHLDADSQTAPTAYGANRMAAALVLRQQAAKQGVAMTHLRTDYVYGPLQDETRFIPTAIRAARTGAILPLVQGDAGRDYVHVLDVVEACLRAASLETPQLLPVDVASGKRHTAGEVVAILGEIMGRDIPTVTDETMLRAWDRPRTPGSPPSPRWTPQTDLNTGLRGLLDLDARA